MTQQRRLILTQLQERRDHPTAEMVWERASKDRPQISLATVYRNLARLVGEGLIQELPDQGRGKRYDGNRLPHHHFFCQSCGTVEDLFAGLPGTLKESLSRIAHGEVKQVQVLLHGICDDCQKQDPTGGSRQ